MHSKIRFFGFILLAAFGVLQAQYHTPPHAPVRMPAMWEKQSDFILAWPDNFYDTSLPHYKATVDIIKQTLMILKNSDCKVHIISKFDKKFLQSQLGPFIDMDRIGLINHELPCPSIRSATPLTIHTHNATERGLVNFTLLSPVDINLLKKYSEYFDIPTYGIDNKGTWMLNPHDNLLSDGYNSGFFLANLIHNNPHLNYKTIANNLMSYFGLERLAYCECYPGFSANRDAIVRVATLADEETILLNLPPERHPLWRYYMQTVATSLSLEYNCYDREYRVVWIPCELEPADMAIWSYTNFSFVNDKLLIPKYGVGTIDDKAKFIISEACPGYDVRQVDISSLAEISQMNLHKISSQIAAPRQPQIKHARLFDQYIFPIRGEGGKYTFLEYESEFGYPVIAWITGYGEPTSVELVYNTGKKDTSIPMRKIDDITKEYQALLPAFPPGTRVHYKIKAHYPGAHFTKPVHSYYDFKVVKMEHNADPVKYSGGVYYFELIEDGLEYFDIYEFASAKGITILADIKVENTTGFLEAPVVGYKEPPGVWDWLTIHNSKLYIRTDILDLPKLQVGKIPDANGVPDSSALRIHCFKEAQFEQLNLQSDGVVKIHAQEGLIFGPLDPPAAGQLDPAIVYEGFTKAEFTGRNITITRPFSTMATFPNILDDTGYMHFLTPEGYTHFIPPESYVMDFSIWNEWMIKTASFKISQSQFNLQMDAKLSMYANKSLKIDNTSINLTDVVQEPTTVWDVMAAKATLLNTEIWGSAIDAAWKEVYGENVVIEMCPAYVPRFDNGRQLNGVQAPVSSEQLSFQAESLDLENSAVHARGNATVKIEAGSIRLGKRQVFSTDTSGTKIQLRALTAPELAAHNSRIAKAVAAPVRKTPEKVPEPPRPVISTIDLSKADTDSLPVEKTVETADFSLQNYPNPFNASTSLSMALPQTANIKVEIYDVTGRRIKTLHDGIAERGVYDFHWRALDMASGTYFCLVHGFYGDGSALRKVQKMLLIK